MNRHEPGTPLRSERFRRSTSALERRNRRRRSAPVVTLIGVLGAALFTGSLLLFVVILSAASGRGRFYAAEPTLLEVIDGDTIDVQIGYERERIRLLGIDTPETKDPRKPVQCFGPEATEHTKELLPPGTILRLELDLEARDSFDRLLAYVWRASDGLFVNLDLVSQGFADVLSIAPNTAHADEFRAALAASKTGSRGRWARC